MQRKLLLLANAIPDVIMILIPFAFVAIFLRDDLYGSQLSPVYRFIIVFGFSILGIILRVILIYHRISPITSIIGTVAFTIILSVLAPLITVRREVLIGGVVGALVLFLLIFVIFGKKLKRFECYLKPAKNHLLTQKEISEKQGKKDPANDFLMSKEELVQSLHLHQQRKLYKQSQKKKRGKKFAKKTLEEPSKLQEIATSEEIDDFSFSQKDEKDHNNE